MQTTLDVILSKKYLVASVFAVLAFNLAVNLISKDVAIFAGNLAYIPLAGSFMILALITIFRFGLTGTHGVAWFSFAGYAVSWFIAEILWIHEELILKENPYPSVADIFYLVGYPFLLMFFISYLQPVKNAITRKIFGISTSLSIGVLIVSLYFVLTHGTMTNAFSTALATVYPIFDSIVIIPAIIGVVLFFKGKVNLMWTLVCIGTICVFAADTAFLVGQLDETYYTGNPIEVLFYLNYVFLIFGVHDHLGLFKKAKNLIK